ncbi:hypothetical protein [Pseudonocardia parietis]|uniref:Uncharacterized protein n=1 Tax=Pseudonocardia parietis TaxID=570936 RepID=A0ABS4VRY0_9PSEU|nr:hypothetical protein [Pseudonocardia parietis]MBP2366666.1 hypothetical protein [Pseudonocardia parietis]
MQQFAGPKSVSRQTAAMVVDTARDAVKAGVPPARLTKALGLGGSGQWKAFLQSPDAARDAGIEAVSSAPVHSEVEVARAADALRQELTPLGITSDARTGVATIDFPADPALAGGTGTETILVDVVGGQVGDDTWQNNRFRFEAEMSTSDVDTFLERGDVSEAPPALAQDPESSALQAAVTEVLQTAAANEPEPGPSTDGLKIAPQVTEGAAAASGSNKAVTLQRCTNVQVGNGTKQRNVMVRAFTAARGLAVLIKGDPRIAHDLTRAAADPRNRAAQRRLGDALTRTAGRDLHSEIGTAVKSSRVYAPPRAGRSLTLTGGVGVAVGDRAVQRNSYRLSMRQDRGALRDVRSALRRVNGS